VGQNFAIFALFIAVLVLGALVSILIGALMFLIAPLKRFAPFVLVIPPTVVAYSLGIGYLAGLVTESFTSYETDAGINAWSFASLAGFVIGALIGVAVGTWLSILLRRHIAKSSSVTPSTS
jgi:glucose-6-phosphate-specific signal transduction histidine kinase